MYFLFGPYLLLSRFSYTNIVESKYRILMLCMAMLVMLTALDWEHTKGQCFAWVKGNRTIAVAMAVFAAAMVLSFVISDNKTIAWFGTAGRYTGTFAMLLILVSTFLISVRFRYKRRLLDWFLCFGLAASVWGIANFAGADVFGMISEIENGASGLYVSGIGQKTFYAALLLMLTAISMVLCIFEKERKKFIFYFAATGIFYLAGYLSRSDNYFFALFFIFIILPVWAFADGKRAFKAVNLLLMLSVIAVILNLAVPYTDDVNEQFDISARVLIRYGLALVIMGVCIMADVVFVVRSRIYGKKLANGTGNRQAPVRGECNVCKGWPVFPLLAAVVFLSVVAMILYFTFVDKTTYLHHLEYFLRFNDVWGSNRGFAWQCSWNIFTHSYIFRRIFGYGADMTGELMKMYFKDYAFAKGKLFDNAHNEYLQYLLTYGLFGVSAYVGMAVTWLRRLVKNINPDILAVFLAVCAYLIQGLVSVNNIIVTPLVFFLLGVGMACAGGRRAG